MDEAATIAGAVLRIDLDAIVHNYRALGRQVAPARIGAVVKADAYGLGAAAIVPALRSAGCTEFFVAQLGEVLALDPALRDGTAFYVLNGLMPGAEAACAAAGAIPVLNALDQVARWSACATDAGRMLPALLQIDTGMSRLGMPVADATQLAAEPARLASVELRAIMSHLACGDDPDDAANARQADCFHAIADRFPGVARSLDNSGGAFLPRAGHFDIARTGIALYGGAPQIGRANPMRPVVALDARIVQVRDVAVGAGVGYGLSFHAARATRIATIALGYADGWPRHLSNRGAAFIGGVRVPIVGRVSMDSITLDVTDMAEALLAPGAPVELLGPHQTIDDVAADAGTISYEILTRLGRRFARTYLPVRSGQAAGSEDA